MAYILLGAENKVLMENIQHKMEAEKKEPCDAKLYDFDDVYYRLFVDPDKREKMLIELNTPNWSDIKSKGSEEWIREKLGKHVDTVSNDGVQFTVDLTDSKCIEAAEETGRSFGKLRIFALGGPLWSYCKALQKGSPKTDTFDFKMRRDTHMWICGGKDRVVCIFAFEFPIEADHVIAGQILKEFAEVRRGRDLAATPSVTFDEKNPPQELAGKKLPPVDSKAFLGYFSILLQKSHVATDEKLEIAVENVIGFRAYLTYHIKCAKAYFHSRMRSRVKNMLQVLNRARYEPDDSRKKKKIIVGTDKRKTRSGGFN